MLVIEYNLIPDNGGGLWAPSELREERLARRTRPSTETYLNTKASQMLKSKNRH